MNPGIPYLSKSDIWFGRYEFPKFGYFSIKRLTEFRGGLPELVAGVGEERRLSQVAEERRRGRRGESVGQFSGLGLVR